MAKKFTKKQINSFPPYIKFGENGCAMRLHNPEQGYFLGRENFVEYWRDGGLWGVDIVIDKETGKLYSLFQDDKQNSLSNVELIPCTRAVWKKCNGQYVDNTDQPYKMK